MKKKMLEKQVYKLCSYQNQSSISENAMDIEKDRGLKLKKLPVSVGRLFRFQVSC